MRKYIYYSHSELANNTPKACLFLTHPLFGNLSFYLEDKEHPNYRRYKDYDLLHEQTLSSYQIEKGQYSVPFLDGSTINIHNIAKIMNTPFQIPNKGLLYMVGNQQERGHLYIHLKTEQL